MFWIFESKYKRNFYFVLFVLVFLVGFVYFLSDIFAPFFISLLIAYILNPIYEKLQAKGLSAYASLLIIFGVISILFVLIITLLVPRLYRQLENSGDLLLGETITIDHDEQGNLLPNGVFDVGSVFLIKPEVGEVKLNKLKDNNHTYYEDLNQNNKWDEEEPLYHYGDERIRYDWEDKFLDTNNNGKWDGNIVNKFYERGKDLIDDRFKENDVQRVKVYLKAKLKDFVEIIKEKLSGEAPVVRNGEGQEITKKTNFDNLWENIKAWILYILWLILIPVYSFFLLKGLNQIKLEGKKYIPAQYRDHVLHVLKRIDSSISAFFMGRLAASLIISVVCCVFFLLSNVEFSIIFGFLLGFAVMMPVVNIVVVIPPAILVYANYGAGMELVYVLLAYLTAVILDTILTPALIGKKANLHIVTVILAFFVFGKLLGVIGLVLAIPFAATTKILFEEYVLPRIIELSEENGEKKLHRSQNE